MKIPSYEQYVVKVTLPLRVHAVNEGHAVAEAALALALLSGWSYRGHDNTPNLHDLDYVVSPAPDRDA